MADRVLTEYERKRLDDLARAIEIEPARAGRLESEIKGEVYRAAVSEAVADGVVSSAEAAALDTLRKSLDIGRGIVLGASEDLSRDTYLSTLRRIVASGQITMKARWELAKVKQALALSDDDAVRMAQEHDQAISLYRQLFTSIMQDGVVTSEEEQSLNWLQRELGIPDRLVASCQDRMKKVKGLAAYREGRLPALKTAKLLEGGETCHWDGSGEFVYQTTRNILRASGTLVVTSKRIIFSSPTKAFLLSPAKSIDLRRTGRSVTIEGNGRVGAGDYLVGDGEMLEAILVGVVRKHKFLLAENYSSAKTRHIPDDVKREVWDRDGARCVRCSATDYLEFDHIIPHGRGGSNSVRNVQLLCRRCNNEKSDRI